MIRKLPLLLALALAAGGALAGERRMLTAEEAQDWAAVGRLNVAGVRFCTATLVAEDVALTAAHCLYNPRTKKRTPLTELRFVLGLRVGGHVAWRRVARAAVLPEYEFDGVADLETIKTDVALLALERPVTEAEAFAVAGALGREATVVSYARDRPHAPSIHDGCTVRATWGVVSALNCDVTYGASGAPVFDSEGGRPRIVGVVSAMGDDGDVALTVAPAPAMERLLTALRAGD